MFYLRAEWSVKLTKLNQPASASSVDRFDGRAELEFSPEFSQEFDRLVKLYGPPDSIRLADSDQTTNVVYKQ